MIRGPGGSVAHNFRRRSSCSRPIRPEASNVQKFARAEFMAISQQWPTGTAPRSYQWAKDGSPVVGATAATLSLTGLQAADTGAYTVTITNPFGTATRNGSS